jgi:chromosome segregation ATPase
MNPEELDSELNKLWAKVAGSQEHLLEPFIPFPDVERYPSSRSTAFDALTLVKRQYREHKARWEKILEAKEEAVQSLSQNLRRAEAEIAELRRQAQSFDVRLVTEVSELAQKLETAQSLLKLEEEKFFNEERRLVATLGRLDNENRRWQQREKDLLKELQELQAQFGKSREEALRFSKQVADLNSGIREGREAVAATLAELLTERQIREKAETDLADAKSRLTETTERLARMEKLWEEERRQWQELFQRERQFHLP